MDRTLCLVPRASAVTTGAQGICCHRWWCPRTSHPPPDAPQLTPQVLLLSSPQRTARTCLQSAPEHLLESMIDEIEILRPWVHSTRGCMQVRCMQWILIVTGWEFQEDQTIGFWPQWESLYLLTTPVLIRHDFGLNQQWKRETIRFESAMKKRDNSGGWFKLDSVLSVK